jgi:hypothetical protein
MVTESKSFSDMFSAQLLSSPEAIKGAEILAETRKEIQSYEHIIPTLEMGPFTEALVMKGKGFVKFGDRFLKYVEHHLTLIRIREAAKLALVDLKTNTFMDHSSCSLAVGKMGVGECGEITQSICTKAVKAKLPEVFSLFFTAEDPHKNHSFSIFGKGVKKQIHDNIDTFSKGKVIEFIEKLTCGIILDGTLLTKPIAAKDVRQCPEFIKYLKFNSIAVLHSPVQFASTVKMDECIAMAEKVRAKMVEILPTIPTDQSFQEALNIYKFAVPESIKKLLSE